MANKYFFEPATTTTDEIDFFNGYDDSRDYTERDEQDYYGEYETDNGDYRGE